MPRRGSPYGPDYERFRRAMLARGDVCVHCLARGVRVPAAEPDHQPPLTRHAHVEGSGCCLLVPSCGPCQRRQAVDLANETRAGRAALVASLVREPSVEPVGFDVGDAAWDVAVWLDELRDVPPDATWPRLMTVPHPEAVGSLGPEFLAWAQAREGRRFRWWQRLVAWRLLEVDAGGLLVWDTLILTLARQLGKSWLLRELLLWRIHQSARFGEEQLALHTGKDVAICREVQRPARIWARVHGDEMYTVREVNGQEEIAHLGDGFASRWMIRARDAVYGISATMVGVDEGWKVKAEAIEEGVVPTMVEHEQTQLLLISTAHRAATTLMLRRRADGIAALGTGAGDLLIEWSAPRAASIEDRDGWRLASPHWSTRRERLIERRVIAALAGIGDQGDPDEPDPVESVRAQWLNVWPDRITRAPKGDPLVDEHLWRQCCSDDDAAGALVIGIDDHHGQGAAVGFVGTLDDGRLVLGGQCFADRARAMALVSRATALREGSVLVGPQRLLDELDDADLVDVAEVRPVAAADTAAALAMLRESLKAGTVVHDGSPALTEQIVSARVTTTAATGLHFTAGQRVDLVRAVTWALRTAVVEPPPEPDIFV